MKKVCWYGKDKYRLRPRNTYTRYLEEHKELYFKLKRGHEISVPTDVADILINKWNCGIEYVNDKDFYEEKPKVEEKKQEPKQKQKYNKKVVVKNNEEEVI